MSPVTKANLLILLGSAAGALIYKWLLPGVHTGSRQTWAETVLVSCSMLVVFRLGKLPEAMAQKVESDPILLIATTLVLTGILGVGLVAGLRAALSRYLPDWVTDRVPGAHSEQKGGTP